MLLSSDGKWLVTGSPDRTARLWEAATGTEVRAYHGHSKEVLSVSLSSDGKWLVTGSADHTARLWDVATGKEVRAFRGHLQNADENVLDDDLGLMPQLRKRVIEQGYAPRGPGEQAAVYVDADEMPGALRPTVKYTVEGKTVQVRVLLRQDGKTVGVVQVEGSRDRLDALTDRLAVAIVDKSALSDKSLALAGPGARLI